MDLDAIAPMIVLVVLIITAGGVAILRPIAKQLADLLHVMTQERLGLRSAPPDESAAQLREVVSALENRLALLEERQGFTEALLDAGTKPLNGGRAGAPMIEGRVPRAVAQE